MTKLGYSISMFSLAMIGCMNGAVSTEEATGESQLLVDPTGGDVTSVAEALGVAVDSDASCLSYPELSGDCGPFQTAGGWPVCACRVDEEPDVPSCSEIDSRAPTAARFRIERDTERRWFIGTYPDLRGVEDLADRQPETWRPGRIPAFHEMAARDKSPCESGYEWIIPNISPDSQVVALGHVYRTCGDGKDTAASLLRCDSAESSGWIIENMFPHTTNPLVNWGWGGDDRRTIYLVAGPYYAIEISVEAQDLIDEEGNQLRGIVLGSVRQIAHDPPWGQANGDPGVTFNRRGGEWGDAYAVFLAPEPVENREHNGCWPDGGIMVSDLRDCREDCDADLKYCCKTAIVDVGCPGLEQEGGAPTNPTLSLDGRLVAFHRDLVYGNGQVFPSTAYLLHNPLANGLEGCVESDDPDSGFSQPIDCRPLMSDHESWASPGNHCPPITDCGVDRNCPSCASIGSFDATRNEIGFFEWPAQDGSFRQFFYFMRDNEHLDMYEIDLEGNELRSPSQVLDLSFLDGTPYSAWGTGFHRVAHSGTL